MYSSKHIPLILLFRVPTGAGIVFLVTKETRLEDVSRTGQFVLTESHTVPTTPSVSGSVGSVATGVR